MPKSVDDEILDRLDKILRVLGLQVGADKSITERARLLKTAGLDNLTIAEVLNTTPAAVRTFTSNLRTHTTPRRQKRTKRSEPSGK